MTAKKIPLELRILSDAGIGFNVSSRLKPAVILIGKDRLLADKQRGIQKPFPLKIFETYILGPADKTRRDLLFIDYLPQKGSSAKLCGSVQSIVKRSSTVLFVKEGGKVYQFDIRRSGAHLPDIGITYNQVPVADYNVRVKALRKRI